MYRVRELCQLHQADVLRVCLEQSILSPTKAKNIFFSLHDAPSSKCPILFSFFKIQRFNLIVYHLRSNFLILQLSNTKVRKVIFLVVLIPGTHSDILSF